MKQCLYCYLPLTDLEIDFHGKCCKKIFDQAIVPELPYHENTLVQLANQEEGFHSKLFLKLIGYENKGNNQKFEVIGEDGEFVLKISGHEFSYFSELEDLTMHLATLASIKVVPHSLMRFASNKLSSLSRRNGSVKKEKVYFKDLCQLMNLSHEEKYEGSYEMILGYIQKYSANPGLDTVNLLEILLFSFLTGNVDMHLKKFSFMHHHDFGAMLAPAYDLTSKVLMYPSENEDFALTLNNKKKKINVGDFVIVATAAKLTIKQQENILNKMINSKPQWLKFIDNSFLSQELKTAYKDLIESRFSRIIKNKN